MSRKKIRISLQKKNHPRGFDGYGADGIFHYYFLNL